MTLAVTASVSIRADDGALELLSAACGACAPCRHGAPDHCIAPGSGFVVARWSAGSAEQPDLVACAAAICTVESLARSSAGPRIGVVGSGIVREVVGACLSGLPDVSVVEPDDDRDREEVRRLSTALRTGPAGRPSDVVITLDGDLRLAGLLVRRGGAVVSPVPVRVPIPMTSLVQRELTVVPTLDIATRAAESPLLAELAWRPREVAA